MQNPNPKNTRDKRLHIVYFTDASRTKSTSISFRGIYLSLGLAVAFFGLSATSLYFYSSSQIELRKYKSYIKDLKAGLVAQVLVGQQKNTEKALTIEELSSQIMTVASEVRRNPVFSNTTAVPVENLQGALKSTLNDQLADKKAPIDFAAPKKPKIKFSPNSEVLPSTTTSLAAKPLEKASKKLDKPLVKFANLYAESEEGESTTLRFELTNSDQANIKSIFGRVCAVVSLKNELLPDSSPSKDLGWITVPPELNLDAKHQVTGPCPSGETVRFARLRPTSVVLPVSQEAIETVVLYFAELPSGKLTLHTIKNINDL